MKQDDFLEAVKQEGLELEEVLEKVDELKSLNSQIGKLSKITELIASGKYFSYYPNSHQLSPEHPFLKLASNFNKMVKEIKQYQNFLEDKIKERTNALEQKNNELKILLEEVNGLKKQQDKDYYLTLA
ncbi:MAG: hypothetical protein AAF518_08655, partial [Spirochaetota bacterium]